MSLKLNIDGVSFAQSEHLPEKRWEQVRFPRSKKRRMRKKWRKDTRNWKLVDATGTMYRCNFPWMKVPVVLVHPKMMKRLKEGCIPNVQFARNVQTVQNGFMGIDRGRPYLQRQGPGITMEDLIRMLKNCEVVIK